MFKRSGHRHAIVVSDANHLRTGAVIPNASATDLEIAARLRLSVTRLARRLRQQTAEGLSPSQGSALATIERHGSLTPSELASMERIQRPTATRILAALVDAGLVSRETDAADRRITRVTLTPEGAALLRHSRSRRTAYLARRLERLEPEELETLGRAAELLELLIADDVEPGA